MVPSRLINVLYQSSKQVKLKQFSINIYSLYHKKRIMMAYIKLSTCDIHMEMQICSTNSHSGGYHNLKCFLLSCWEQTTFQMYVTLGYLYKDDQLALISREILYCENHYFRGCHHFHVGSVCFHPKLSLCNSFFTCT